MRFYPSYLALIPLLYKKKYQSIINLLKIYLIYSKSTKKKLS